MKTRICLVYFFHHCNLEHYSFGHNFIEWIKILRKNQESCVINGGDTKKYFRLEREARQGYPISAYLFIIAFEILFIFVKFDKKGSMEF